MARPKKQAEHKNNIMLRLTDTQYEIVSEYARLMGLPVAVYAREVITEGRHPIQCNIVRDEYRQSKKSEEFYEKHRAEITLYETARDNLRAMSGGQKLPSIRKLISMYQMYIVIIQTKDTE